MHPGALRAGHIAIGKQLDAVHAGLGSRKTQQARATGLPPVKHGVAQRMPQSVAIDRLTASDAGV